MLHVSYIVADPDLIRLDKLSLAWVCLTRQYILASDWSVFALLTSDWLRCNIRQGLLIQLWAQFDIR